MKNIVVPTDFSDNSENALEFACGLNKKLNAEIVLIHSYHVPVPVSDSNILPISEYEVEKIALDQLHVLKTKIQERNPDMRFSVHATLGLADVEIPGFAKENKSDLIVMGTHGATGLKEFLIGSNAATVIENSTVPVMAIPEKAKFNGINKIVFAADYGNHNYNHMLYVIDLAKYFNAEIIMLHITSGKLEDNFEDLEIGRFKEHIIKESGYRNISYRLMEDKDVFHGLDNYLDQFPPSLLVMSIHDRNIVKKIFSRSLTKRMAYHSNIPVLALHIKK